MVWHEKLESFVAVLYELKTLSHVRIGTGENIKLPTPIDNPQSRILRLEPTAVSGGEGEGSQKGPAKLRWTVYIPASSLHGILRSALEDYLRSMLGPVKTVKEVLDVLKDNSVKRKIERLKNSIPGFEDLPLYREVCYTTLDFDNCQLPVPNDKEEYLTKLVLRKDSYGNHLPCFVCQLFGAPGLRGRVRILNAYPSKELEETLPLDVMTRVAINRVTGAAEEGKLFDLEAIPPGAKFYFFVVINNAFSKIKIHDQGLEEEKYVELLGLDEGQQSNCPHGNTRFTYFSLFQKSIELINSGAVPIGAHGTIGFGTVEIRKIAVMSINGEDETKKFIRFITKQSIDPKEISDKIEACVSNPGEIPDLDEKLYPRLARILVNETRNKISGGQNASNGTSNS